ncbi:MAG: hypothetical protein ABIS26_02380 [Candidatus Paceibacterota bacterium]
MENTLKNEVLAVVNTLKGMGKQKLASCIEENWNKNALAYSRELNSYRPEHPMEPELRSAFSKELDRLEVMEPKKSKILDSLQRRRILQTAPHLGVTESPRMLCINWLGSLGVAEEDFYVVGMFSGIPFSNSSRPGRINREKDAVNLFPSSMQDDLVFRSFIPEKLVDSVAKLPDKLKNLLPSAKVGDSYTKWALASCSNIEKKILEKENLVYLDINEVVANYLEGIKAKPDHPMNKIKELSEIFPDENLFHKNNPDCPGLLVTFLALTFLNGFKCFGSFRQVEYLPEYQEKLAKLDFLKKFNVEKVPTSNLTTGSFYPLEVYPADIILGEKFKLDENILFGELLTSPSMKKILYEE